MGEADNLLFLHVHAAKHLWERLFWLWDLKTFHENPDAPKIREVVDRSQELGLHRPVLAGLTLANEFPNLELPHDFPQPDRATLRLTELGRQQLLSPYRPNARHTPLQAFEGAVLLRPGIGYRARVVRNWLGGADDWPQFPLPRCLGWLYPSIRPYFWLRRRIQPPKKS